MALAALGSALLAPSALAGHSADQHSDNVSLVGRFDDGAAYRTGTDLAFWGNRAIAGDFGTNTADSTLRGGFRVLDISSPAAPRELGEADCPGPQNDVSIWRDLVFLSVDTPRGDGPARDGTPRTATQCGAPAASQAQIQANTDWEGVRIFSIADPANPTQIAAVNTDCGSHTHTLMPDEANDRVLVYVLSYPLASQSAADCNANSHRRISVIEVPLSNPAGARVVSTPSVAPAIGCHDMTVLVPRRLAGAACLTEGQMWDISDPVNPRILSHITNPAINIQHSTTFSWDGNTLVIGDELGGALASPGCEAGGQHVPLGALWFYDVSDPAQPVARGTYRIPQSVPTVFCTAHNFNAIPLPSGRDILVSAWYNGGSTVLDFTDPANIEQLGFYIGKEPVQAAAWSSYWYNGLVYANHFDEDVHSISKRSRGVEILSVSHPDIRDPIELPRLNPQVQEALPNRPGVSARGLIEAEPPGAGCRDRLAPRSRFRRGSLRATRRRVSIGGRASDRGCGPGGRGQVQHVLVAVARREGRGSGRCRYLRTHHDDDHPHPDELELGPVVSCRRPTYVIATGAERWRYLVRARLRRGTYTLRSRGLDAALNVEKKRRLTGSRRNFMTFRVR